MNARVVSVRVKQILVVEDNEDDSRLFEIFLKEADPSGIRLKHSMTISDTLDLLREYGDEVDCIILDLSLPDSFGLDGFETIKKAFPKIPIVICSGTEDENMAMEALQAGGQDYLIKGRFDSHLLFRSVLYAIERQDMLSKLEEQAFLIKENEQRYRLLFEHNPHPILLYNFDSERILDLNQETERIYGYDREELLGIKFSELFVGQAGVEEDRRYAPVQNGKNIPETHVHRTKDGLPLLMEITSYRFQLQGKEVVLAILVDMTKWKQSEDSLLQSLRDKEALLQEIHHRVKNNLQIMASLLNLQANYAKNKEVTRELKDTESRIYSMSLVHNELYNSKSLAEIGLRSYVDKLLDNLWNVYGIGSEIKREIDVGQLSLAVEKALPIGMMINEIATNSIKYAYQEKKQGQFYIKAKFQNGVFLLVVGDDGKGIPDYPQIESKETLGLQLIRILSKQLKAKLDINTAAPGTRFQIEFSY
ncbi:histidine kinase dimerization/phosphoacceptor domain -containing protein [Leptospira sarikeiensis]|uniref:histidine kinase n=1 Tax=Leptospira sarikeiensis TaxID=2484943 RepID=A0A4R9K0U6_9LEPT|nr:histidine kinase dimerization/phosphoacceptor domain -containing protein [Leptospira sarikeiensis]TGL58318.1 response regulator [Leptospira sarikeiensis]